MNTMKGRLLVVLDMPLPKLRACFAALASVIAGVRSTRLSESRSFLAKDLLA
jgi:hypothetical protein